MTIHDFYNPLVRWLLRSRLHGVMSRRTLLVTYTGRRSGREFTTPADYARQGDVVTVVSQTGHTWWRNLQGGVPVTVTLLGQARHGLADVTRPNLVGAGQALRLLYPTMPASMVARLAPEAVVIRIHLGEQPGKLEPDREAVHA